jgi:hypothetical protein
MEFQKACGLFRNQKIKKFLGGLMENPPEVAGPVF